MKFIKHIWFFIIQEPCPYDDIKWNNIGMEYNRDTFHDQWLGKCKVCGARHIFELGFYHRGNR